MEELTFYFNELSLASNAGNTTAINPMIKSFVDAIEVTMKLRPDCKFGFIENNFHAIYMGQTLSEQIKRHLANKKTVYWSLLTKIKRLEKGCAPLDHEVKFQGNSAIGLTLADIATHQKGAGWTFSLANEIGEWLDHLIQADRYMLDSQGDLNGPNRCEISNISETAHVETWQQRLFDWGMEISPSSTLDMLGPHPIVMYSAPLEHNPPHVHLLESASSRKTLAKFRIEDFVREQGKPSWDLEMRAWLQEYQSQLLRSWERCQKGGHPFKLKE